MKNKDRKAWIKAGLRILASEGIESVRVEPLAKQLGVTKGSFYWHFRNREDLHEAMLEAWVASATDGVIAQAESEASDPQTRLRRLIELASSGFDGEFELAIRNWARRDVSVAVALEEVDRRRMEYLRRLLSESGFEPCESEARAFLLYALLLGDYLLPEAHGRYSRKRVLRECLELLGA